MPKGVSEIEKVLLWNIASCSEGRSSVLRLNDLPLCVVVCDVVCAWGKRREG